MKKKKSNFSNLIIIIAFVIGFSLLLYPTVSNWWNSFHQTQAIADYNHVVETVAPYDKEKMLADARKYNERLAGKPQGWILTDTEKAEYESLLDVAGTGMMGYVEVPVINVSLPVYHGVEDSVLQVAVGHIEGSSLPVGGSSTHCVISGHRGLPSAKLFSNLDQVAEGDVFMLNILGETLTYEVDQIRIVEPEELDELKIQAGKDFCTLVTCTPYGVNSHRMLVRGERIENIEDFTNIGADAIEVDKFIVAVIIAVIVLFILFAGMMFVTGRKRERR